jgi:hypothetical protein
LQRVGGVVVDGGRAVAAARRPEQQQQTHIGTAAHLAAGGLAGGVSKTSTAPLARLTILFQVHSFSTQPSFALPRSRTYGLGTNLFVWGWEQAPAMTN